MKKLSDVLLKEKEKFVNACVSKNGFDREDSNKLFEKLLLFSLYSFNSAHCLSSDTIVIDNNENHLPILKVKELLDNNQNVYLQAIDIDTQQPIIDECIKFYDNGMQELFEVEFEDGSIVKCTLNHKFLCSDYKMHTLQDIITNDLLIVFNKKSINYLKIKSIKPLGLQQTYDLEMASKNHNFILSNGVVSSNSCAYSHITCHTAYISSKYPIEFYTAALTIDAGNTDDVRRYIAGAKKRGINILPPCINKSSVNFDIINNDILFGLTAIKGVGNSVSNKIIKNRPKKSGYTSFGHFVMRNIDILNKRILESYAKAGVFNCFGLSKNSYLDSIDRLLEFISYMKELGNRNTTFDILGLKISDYIDSIIITSSSRSDSLFYEIESLGLYITGHPFDGYLINTDVVTPIKSILDDMDVTWVDGDIGSMKTVVGVIAGIDVRKTKAKVNMATFNLSDNDNLMQCTMFPKAYSEYGYLAKEGLTVVLDGHLKKDTVGPIFIIKKAYSIGSKRGALMKILCEEKVTDNRKRRTIRVNSRLSFILTEE